MVCPAQIFNQLQTPFTAVNILEDDRLRSGMKEYSQWPTFPQVYIDGEFYGGCDILIGARTRHAANSRPCSCLDVAQV